MSDLVELARRYVAASDVLESLRNEIRRAVLNGGGEKPEAPFSRPARPSGGKSTKAQAQARHPNALKAQKVDQEIVAMLRDRPGLKTMEIAKAMDSKTSTTVERLRRLTARGQVQRDEQGGWASTPSP
jgi:DNA-directed RNA polymerase specialized sigma24 family protein